MDKSLQQPLVSVIIPTYKRADIINRTIDSVLQQTYKNLEIIIVDDCSKDNTEEVVKAIADPRIQYISNQTNQGASVTRNNGVAAATGNYIAFLDSDDIWLPNKVELQLAAIQNYPESEKVVSYTQVTNDEGYKVSVLPTREKKPEEPVADYLFVARGLMQTGTLMMPRKLAIATPFRPGIVPYEDMDLCLRLDADGAQFVYVEQPLTVWNNERRTNRVTNSRDYEMPLNWIREYEHKISPKAMKGFMVHWMVGLFIESECQRLYGEQLLIDAVLHGVISVKQFSILSARITIPKRIRQRLKRLANKILSRPMTETPEISS